MASITPGGVYSFRDSAPGSSSNSDLYVPPSSRPEGGQYIKSIVYGGLDGVLTTFAIISAATGSGMSTLVILILGFSNKFADALSMGLGDALSSMAERDHILQERERER